MANKAATKKRNVLERCIIPKITLSIRYIVSELEELEREDNFRLKRFKELKYKRKAKEAKGKMAILEKQEEITPVIQEVPTEPEIVEEKKKEEPLILKLQRMIKSVQICPCCLIEFYAGDLESFCPICAEAAKVSPASDIKVKLIACEEKQKAEAKAEEKIKESENNYVEHLTLDGILTPSMQRVMVECEKQMNDVVCDDLAPCSKIYEQTVYHISTPRDNSPTKRSVNPIRPTVSTTSGKDDGISSRCCVSTKTGPLGYLKKKFRGVVRVKVIVNSDGTIGEERQIIAIKKEIRNYNKNFVIGDSKDAICNNDSKNGQGNDQTHAHNRCVCRNNVGTDIINHTVTSSKVVWPRDVKATQTVCGRCAGTDARRSNFTVDEKVVSETAGDQNVITKRYSKVTFIKTNQVPTSTDPMKPTEYCVSGPKPLSEIDSELELFVEQLEAGMTNSKTTSSKTCVSEKHYFDNKCVSCELLRPVSSKNSKDTKTTCGSTPAPPSKSRICWASNNIPPCTSASYGNNITYPTNSISVNAVWRDATTSTSNITTASQNIKCNLSTCPFNKTTKSIATGPSYRNVATSVTGLIATNCSADSATSKCSGQFDKAKKTKLNRCIIKIIAKHPNIQYDNKNEVVIEGDITENTKRKLAQFSKATCISLNNLEEQKPACKLCGKQTGSAVPNQIDTSKTVVLTRCRQCNADLKSKLWGKIRYCPECGVVQETSSISLSYRNTEGGSYSSCQSCANKFAALPNNLNKGADLNSIRDLGSRRPVQVAEPSPCAKGIVGNCNCDVQTGAFKSDPCSQCICKNRCPKLKGITPKDNATVSVKVTEKENSNYHKLQIIKKAQSINSPEDLKEAIDNRRCIKTLVNEGVSVIEKRDMGTNTRPKCELKTVTCTKRKRLERLSHYSNTCDCRSDPCMYNCCGSRKSSRAKSYSGKEFNCYRFY